MAEEDCEMESYSGSKRRTSDTPILVHPQKDQEFANSNQENDGEFNSNESSSSSCLISSSSPNEDRDNIPSPSKKAKSSFSPHEVPLSGSLINLENSDFLIQNTKMNQELLLGSFPGQEKNVICDLGYGSFECDVDGKEFSGNASVSEEALVPGSLRNVGVLVEETEMNQEMVLGSLSGEKKNGGSFAFDVNYEDFSRSVYGSEVELLEVENNQQKGILCELASGCGNNEDFPKNVGNHVQSQKNVDFVDVDEANRGQIVNGVKTENCLSEVQEFDKYDEFLEDWKSIDVERGSIIEEEKETLLEAKKKELLAKVEAAAGFFGGFKAINESVTPSLEVDLIDDTAVIGTFPAVKNGNRGARNAESNIKKNEKQGADRKKSKQPRRKRKDVKKGSMINDKENKMSLNCKVEYNVGLFSQYHDDGKRKGDQLRKYPRDEMEALRFVNIDQQRQLWRAIFTGLGDTFAKDYNDLARSKCNQKNVHLNSDPRNRFGRNIDTSGILGEECSENGDKLENIGEDGVENVNFSVSFSESIGVKDSYIEGEYYEEEDSDDDYSSIQRPAFIVEGEPDFDSGPPEDGLEYLRRVRWEAAQIPNVKVAKIDRSKVKKEQSIYMPQIPEITNCPEHLLPSKQWEDAFLTDFSELRTYLSSHWDYDTEISSMLQSVVLVDVYDTCPPQPDENIIIDKFNYLTTGESHNLMTDSEQLDESSHNTADHESAANAGNTEGLADSQHNISFSAVSSPGSYPTWSKIVAMDAVARGSMLRKHITSKETLSTLSKIDCMWLYALCAAVDTPLDADTSAAIRSLLRKLASLRAAKSELDDDVIMLNILITISGKYFGQSEK